MICGFCGRRRYRDEYVRWDRFEPTCSKSIQGNYPLSILRSLIGLILSPIIRRFVVSKFDIFSYFQRSRKFLNEKPFFSYRLPARSSKLLQHSCSTVAFQQGCRVARGTCNCSRTIQYSGCTILGRKYRITDQSRGSKVANNSLVEPSPSLGIVIVRE